MPINISKRALSIKPSPTLAVSALTKQMEAAGIEVINFGVGEPDFDTPEYIKNAAKKAIDDNFTHYTISAGLPELRRAIAAKLLTENGLEYRMEDILVSPGAKASIINVLMAICDPYDEVLIPSPFWVSYTSQVEMLDAIPILMDTDASMNFKITASQLKDTLHNLKNPKALILNSPNNPTGAVYSPAELAAIAAVCLEHQILIISDEIYEKLIYDSGKHYSIAQVAPEVRALTVIINGVSKAYAMTGWRLGWAAGPTEIIQRAALIQEHTTSCVNSITQKAAIVALNQDDGSIERMRQAFQKRRDYLVKVLNEIPHVKCTNPQGAFYAFPDVEYYLKNNNAGLRDSIELCAWLAKQQHVALVPGQAFGADNYVRFSFATSLENITKGLQRFRTGLEALR